MLKTINLIKISLAIILLIALLDLPYGYYQLIRFLTFFGFSILSFQANLKENKLEMVIFLGLALLFQPFLKISLGRELWIIIDIIVGLGLIVSIIKKNKPI